MADSAESRHQVRRTRPRGLLAARSSVAAVRSRLRLRPVLSMGLRLTLLLAILWAFTGPVDRTALIVGAAVLPPGVGQAGATVQAAIFFPETGYIVGTGPIGQYFAARGGARTFGPPVSNEFTLMGSRMQLFRDFVLKQDAGGGISTVDVFGMGAVPFRTIGAWTVPEIDQTLVDGAPVPGTPEYGALVQAFIKEHAPDSWDGQNVGFLQAFLSTVTFEDAFPDGVGERSLLAGFAQEVWGLPVSQPQRDAQQPGIVYLRWERGVMVWNSETGTVSAAPLGEAFRSVITGEGLTPEQVAVAAAAESPYLGQANGPLPSGLTRPEALPDTALADAFTRNTSVEAGAVAAQIDPTPTLEGWYSPSTPTYTPVVYPTPTNTPYGYPGAGAQPGNPNVVGPQSGAQQPGVQQPAGQTGLPGAIQPGAAGAPGAAAGSDPCYGDEQITFSPEVPRVGNEVLIAVTSSRPHPYGRLAGTERTTFVRERPGQKGYVWEWTIALSYPGKHEYTFYVDSTIPCKKLELTIRQGLATRTPTPTKTATPYGWDNGNGNSNSNNNNNDNYERAPSIYPYSYIVPGQDLYNCGNFQSQSQAQSVLRADPTDPNRLDAEDGVEDGIACSTYNGYQYPDDDDYNIVYRTYGTPTPTQVTGVVPTATSPAGLVAGAACYTFPNGAAAQAYLRQDPYDPLWIDYNYDGRACGGTDFEPGVGSPIYMSPPFDSTPVIRPTRTPTPKTRSN